MWWKTVLSGWGAPMMHQPCPHCRRMLTGATFSHWATYDIKGGTKIYCVANQKHKRNRMKTKTNVLPFRRKDNTPQPA